MAGQTMTAGTRIGGRYEIVSRIGAGGFGAVYRAHQLDLNRDVAIKTMLPHLAEVEGVEERFRREAELASALSSPHTIRLFDFGKTPTGMLYMVMELLEGRELAKALKVDGPMHPSLVQKIVLEILDSLDEAHEHGVVHRDLKPSNIFLARQRRDENFVKVLDFGIAKAISNENSPEGQQLTATGQALGTPFYMSPEQIRGKNVGGHSDIYSLGLIMLEMLTGHIAMQGETAIDTVLMHVGDKPVPMPPWLAETPLGRIIGAATAKNWQQRYQSADHMLNDLRTVDGEAVAAAAAAAGGAGAWKPVNAPLSGIVDSGTVPQLNSGPIAGRSGPVPTSGAAHTPYPGQPGYPPGGMHTPQPGAMHTPHPAAMYTPHSGINPMLHSQEVGQQGGGRGKLVVLVAIILAVAILGSIAAFTLGGGSSSQAPGAARDGQAEAASAPATDETAATPEATPEAEPLAGTDSALDEVEPEAEQTAVVETVSVTIESDPPGADVVRDDLVLGKTPFTFEEPRAEGTLPIVVSLAEHELASVEVDLSEGGSHKVELARLETDSGKSSARTERRSSRSERRSSRTDKKKAAESSAATTAASGDDKKKDTGSDAKKKSGGSLAVPD